jgi:hypothetical protein
VTESLFDHGPMASEGGAPVTLDGEYPPQAECEHDWITNRFTEKPYLVRVCGWCGLGQGRDSENDPWEFFTQLVGDGLRPRPPLRSSDTQDAPDLMARLKESLGIPDA